MRWNNENIPLVLFRVFNKNPMYYSDIHIQSLFLIPGLEQKYPLLRTIIMKFLTKTMHIFSITPYKGKCNLCKSERVFSFTLSFEIRKSGSFKCHSFCCETVNSFNQPYLIE